MPWLDKLERRAGWLAFPGLFRFFVLLQALALVLSWMNPHLGALLEFDRAKILSGEIWRLFTFLFAAFFTFFLAAFFFEAFFAAGSVRAACAAARRATGTRNGEQLT